jgi:tRNA(fMet)-specific endonuclease VapC
MKYILDTNICIYWLKGNENIEKKILSAGIDNISISFINLSELYYGAYKSQRIDENIAMIQQLSDHVNVIQSDEAISAAFGNLKAGLENVGLIIDDADIFIAACANVHGMTLVTNNAKHFRRIKGLKLVNWI